MTSRYEGSPYLFQDACMASIPIISTDVGGVEFFVKNGSNGYIYSTDDEASLIINKCLVNKNFMNQMPNRSKKILCNFSLENMVNQTLESYFSV